MASSAPDHLRTPGLISNRPCYEGINIWFTCQPKEANGHVPKGCHDLRCCSCANLAAVFVQGHIPHPMNSVLNSPVSPPEGEELPGVGLLG